MRIVYLLIVRLFLITTATLASAIGAPQLQVHTTGANCVLDWDANAACYSLESTTNLTAGPWFTNTAALTNINDRLQVTVRIGESVRYFRLRRPPAASPSPAVLVNGDLGTPGDGSGAEWVQFDLCPSAGCQISDLQAENPNVFDATSSIDWARCSTNDPTMQFQWTIRFPQTDRNGAVYLSSRIQGRNTPVLSLTTNSLPDLGSTTKLWRVELTMTSQVDPTLSKVARFQFAYFGSGMTLADYDNELNGP